MFFSPLILGYLIICLNGDLSERIQNAVVDKRNRFMHAAGAYPTKSEAEQIASDISSCLQTIINLVADC